LQIIMKADVESLVGAARHTNHQGGSAPTAYTRSRLNMLPADRMRIYTTLTGTTNGRLCMGRPIGAPSSPPEAQAYEFLERNNVFPQGQRGRREGQVILETFPNPMSSACWAEVHDLLSLSLATEVVVGAPVR
jgi:hypothetical protein